MGVQDDLLTYYADRYQIVAFWSLRTADRKIVLGNKDNRVCRFCGKAEPEVTFRKDAHAFPECIGNKSLFTHYECDTCNHAFGSGCENDFGNWSLPMRTMARIHGKNGIPTIKQGPNSVYRIDGHPDGLSTNIDETEGFIENDKSARILKFHLRRGPYRPAMVAKAMTKMALSIMPEEELPNFQLALDWIRPGSASEMTVAQMPCLYTFIGGPVANDLITIAVLTRQHEGLAVPYSFLLLRYGHEMLQMILPSIERDIHLYGKRLDVCHFPCFQDDGGTVMRPVKRNLLAFDSAEVIKNDIFVLEFSYQQKIRH
ncbi:hypothetical protein C4901_11575 [Acidiferrobacter sp. SPIII_3]|uniref:HNH endonuclease n=1 Tax=Acidiferrobacter sp. SPIII_3 TaxID=1281578 RepID=UPI000D73AFB3|nr:HNH endonuclease [Acidiferrobacter sp. SPIII_3]AWP23887.1 hypothetical protein C4901_11575 [Acidiferrobacter sp. SPIII_3]